MYENYGWKYVLTAFICVLWGLGLWFNDIPLGLDLKGGSEIIYTLDFQGRAPSTEATEDAVRVLRERIDVLGIKELSIRRQGSYDVVVQVPDATPTEVERIKSQIEKAGRLQFKLLVGGLSELETQAEIERITQQKELGTWHENDRYDVAYWHESARGGIPGQPALVENSTPSGKLLYVDGALLEDAYRALDERGKAAVGFEWNSEGARKFRDLTAANINRNLAVVLDGNIRSAPSIRSEIGKKGIIEGGDQGWNETELTNLIVTLKAGALPAKPVFAYRKDIGAQLGQAAVWIGGVATLASLFGIMLFMLWFYGVRAGMVANIAMLLNLFLLLGTLAMFGATLTLPGIAGIVLGAAMAVDANVLIYERIREENARGAALKQAIQAGYERAFWTIFDSNLTTVLTALVLMWAGTGPIKGFGLTLTIGIVISMFTALFVTQALYGLFVARGIIREVNFRVIFASVNFDYWATFPKAAVMSISLILVGWVVFLARGEEKYGIDFTGGTSLQMVLAEPMEKHDVERSVEAHFASLGQPVQVEIQRVGPRLEGGTELSREWQLRTRLITDTAEKRVSSLGSPLDALISPAYGQDTPAGDTAPANTQTPALEAAEDGADDAAQDGAGDAPQGDAPAPVATATPPQPTTPPTTPPAASAPTSTSTAEDETAKASQEFFANEIRKLVQEKLVDPYPAVDGQEFTTVGAGEDRVRGRFLVELVSMPASGFDEAPTPVTVERLRAELPKVFAALARGERDTGPEATQRKAMFEALAGAEGAPGFTVTEVEGQWTESEADVKKAAKDLGVALKTQGGADRPLEEVRREVGARQSKPVRFAFETHAVPAAQAPRAVDALKTGLERAREQGVFIAPAVPFPNIDQIGSAVAKNLKSKAIVATFFSVLLICLYIWLRFDFWAGITAVVALAHDVMALLGFLAILDLVLSAAGVNFDSKFSLTTITAFLTLIGFSINDTIVILDRIREEMVLAKTKTYTPEVVNLSINRTLSRTALTSGTVFLSVFVLFVASFYGLTAIQGFSIALLFGVASGTYSTVFVAAPLLLCDRRKSYMALGGMALFIIVTAILNTFRS